MDDSQVAEIMEETALTKIRLKLNEKKIKLWEPPYFNKDLQSADESKVHQLAVELKSEIGLSMPQTFQGLLMLQQKALEKLAAKNKYEASGTLHLRLRWPVHLNNSRSRNLEIASSKTGADLMDQISTMIDKDPEMLRIICKGKVVQSEKTLKEQGITTSSTVMILLISSQEDAKKAEERNRMLNQIKEDARRLGANNANDDQFSLQVADQSGRSLELPAAERKALIIAMSLHEKGRAALAKKDYSLALVLLLEAESEFATCRGEIVDKVDNFAILNLDIAWCYLMIQAVSELPNAGPRLDACENKFKESYGTNLERLQTIKGSTGQEAALLLRLHLLQGIVAFHLGREREAELTLKKAQIEMQLLDVNEELLVQLMDMGYTVREARLGLRAAKGDLQAAVDHINIGKEERAKIRAKEKEERKLQKKRKRLGKCADGSWVNVGYYETLLRMGFSEKVSVTALRQANNSLNMAVQLLQEEPELINMAAENNRDAEVATLVSLGYSTEMANIALDNEGNVEAAADTLLANNGNVSRKKSEDDDDDESKKCEDDANAYNRIKDGISQDIEDHLDMDLGMEKEFLEKYLQLLSSSNKSS